MSALPDYTELLKAEILITERSLVQNISSTRWEGSQLFKVRAAKLNLSS